MDCRQPNRRRRLGLSSRETLILSLFAAALAVVLLPNFVRVVHKEAQAEALVGLKRIRAAQSVFHDRTGTYSASLAELGLQLDGGRLDAEGNYRGRHYVFSLSRWNVDGRSEYRAVASANLDGGDPTLDIWMVGSDMAEQKPVAVSNDLLERTAQAGFPQ